MGRNQWKANLDELCRSLEHYASDLPAAPSSSATATRLSDSLYLANSASDANFSAICASGYLFSAARLGKSMPPTCPEMILGTAGSVFFYLSPFRYPNTNCGLLLDRKSTRLNSSHLVISYAVFCLKKKKKKLITTHHKRRWYVRSHYMHNEFTR